MAGTEVDESIALVLATLKADAQVGTSGSLGINGWFQDMAQGALWPFGIVQFQGGTFPTFMSAIRIGVDGLLTVKLVGPDAILSSVLLPGLKRVDTLLQGFTGSNSNVNIFGKLIGEVPINYSEVDTAQVIRHRGISYRFAAQ